MQKQKRGQIEKNFVQWPIMAKALNLMKKIHCLDKKPFLIYKVFIFVLYSFYNKGVD